MNSITSYAKQLSVHDVLARKSVHDVVALNNYYIETHLDVSIKQALDKIGTMMEFAKPK